MTGSIDSPPRHLCARPILARSGADRRRLRVGLMGGSFNPAHQAHREIALLALARLGLDQVWWLVSPQNPLKPSDGMAPLARRMARARAVARHPRILVTDLEARLGTRYTADTVRALVRRCPAMRFVWVMGADNLQALDQWMRWSQILDTVPVAVFDRPTYALPALSSRAARRYARKRLPERRARLLPDLSPPAWVFLHTRLNPLSATRMRARGEVA